ncbi:GWxTD domain-containing protein [Adhaeribacter sp. BT258]|uniref:GWxTD domain-containing protein n=1 Tax=Adhaeribacter terrigena TaxID=2793070 RepID=A0ABS1C8A8_9BACT|nr:GWxTD domain-containing protein [Adhaeribacter terrigena]MBK0404810.1 GWxTD domain-containing protein [Adhaeribacter terrigena]
MKKIFQVLAGCMLVLSFGCRKLPAPSRFNQGFEYQPKTAVQHDLRREGDSLHVYLKFADAGFFSFPKNLQVAYTGFVNYEDTDIILADSVRKAGSRILKTEDGVLFDFKLPVARLKFPMVLQMKLVLRNDPQNALYHDVRLSATEGTKPYVLADAATNLPLFRNYVRANEPFLIAQFGVPQPGEFQRYETVFGAALPPMASQEKTVAPTLKKLQTISFLDYIVSLSEIGLYGIEIGGKSVGGVLVESANFPELVSAQDLIQPLIYLTTAEERNKLYAAPDPKAAVDKFWLGVNPNQNEARRLIRSYYERVTAANRFFTAHKAGWLTDRGMLYLIFGPPEEVKRYSNREEWIYLVNQNHNQARFIFLKKENTFTQNHYELVRSPYYEQVWYDMVEQWRKGTIGK